MDVRAFGPFITNIRGGVGGMRAIHRQGKLTLVKRTKPKLSMTPAAVRTRQVYATLECIWCNMREEFRQGYLLGCRVPHLSGRDLFTRINWHQVAEWDEYRPLPLNLQPMAAVKTHLAGNLAVPAEWLAGLGGPLNHAAAAISGAVRRYRQQTSFGPTVQTAVAGAYAAIAGKPWLNGGAGWEAWHTLRWLAGPPVQADIMQMRSEATALIPEDCNQVRVAVEVTVSFPAGALAQGWLNAIGATIEVHHGTLTGTPSDLKQALASGPVSLTDGDDWSPLTPAAGDGVFTGYEASGAALSWWGRG